MMLSWRRAIVSICQWLAAGQGMKLTSFYNTDPDCLSVECQKEVHDYPPSKAINWTVKPDTSFQNLLRNSTLYNTNVAPGQLEHKVTMVDVAMYVESLSSFRASTMDFDVDMYLAIGWNDTRLRHRHKHPILLIDPELSNRIWIPDLYFVNSKSAHFPTVTKPNFLIYVFNDGYVLKSMRLDLTMSCMMELYDFPFDEQMCDIRIHSFAYMVRVLQLRWYIELRYGFPVSMNSEIKINDMTILKDSLTYDYCVLAYPMFRGHDYWSCLRAGLKMKRRIVFHVLQTYIPTTMLVCISWLSFWLDVRAAPARISLTITTLLTLVSVANGARQDLPQVSYIKAIDIWLTVCTGFVFSVLLEFTLVSYCMGRRQPSATCKHRRTNVGMPWQPNGALLDKPQNRGPCAACIAAIESRAKRIDATSRVLFPSAFGIFSAIYWTFYLLSYYSEPPKLEQQTGPLDLEPMLEL